jgi:hypothetical protein
MAPNFKVGALDRGLLTGSFRILNGQQGDCRAQSMSIMRGSFIPTSSSADVESMAFDSIIARWGVPTLADILNG